MHKLIFQISNQPIDKGDYISATLYGHSNSFANGDYIGREITSDKERHDCIESLVRKLGGMFTLMPNEYLLLYNGKDSLYNFLTDWISCLRTLTTELTVEKILSDIILWRIFKVSTESHTKCEYYFYIKGLDNVSYPLEELIGYIDSSLKEGDKLYIGSIIDCNFL